MNGNNPVLACSCLDAAGAVRELAACAVGAAARVGNNSDGIAAVGTGKRLIGYTVRTFGTKYKHAIILLKKGRKKYTLDFWLDVWYNLFVMGSAIRP